MSKISVRPKRGDIVVSDRLVVLVTGIGHSNAGYRCFSGVVISEDKIKSPEFVLGTYSRTWGCAVFKKIDYKINLWLALDKPPFSY